VGHLPRGPTLRQREITPARATAMTPPAADRERGPDEERRHDADRGRARATAWSTARTCGGHVIGRAGVPRRFPLIGRFFEAGELHGSAERSGGSPA
jgi:hypothetical protein